jgi:adenylate cyclase
LPTTALPLAGLIAAAASSTDLKAAWSAYCMVLRRAGVPLSRATVGLEFLHPDVSGTLTVWTPEAVSERTDPRAGMMQSNDYLASPTYVVDQTDRPFRQRLDRPNGMPLLEGLRQAGATDYLMVPLPFADRSRTANMSFATRAPGGFAPCDVSRLEAAAAIFSPYAERHVLRRMAVDLLDTYVGPRTGRRILSGEIERGHFEMIEAAIWFADFRGFTELAERQPIAETVAALNEWHALAGTVVHDEGGEVLKLIGDGVLAIFPAAAGEPKQRACERAFLAARRLAASVAQRNAWAARRLEFGVGLHFGEIAYGNVGAPNRLDFTAIGPAVNLAARLERATKLLGSPIAASGDFRALLGAPHAGMLEDRGLHHLKGFSRPQPVFATPVRAAPPAVRGRARPALARTL